MRKNLAPWLLVATCATMDALFLLPVCLLYYSAKGADFGGFLALQAIARLGPGLLDVPTGLLADRWDRRRQLIAACALWTSAMVTVTLATGYGGLLAAELLAAFACCLRSGTARAYLHEALTANGAASSTAHWQTRSFGYPDQGVESAAQLRSPPGPGRHHAVRLFSVVQRVRRRRAANPRDRGQRGMAVLLPLALVGGCAVMLLSTSSGAAWLGGIAGSAFVFAVGKPLG
jgi:hypothetical protein